MDFNPFVFTWACLGMIFCLWYGLNDLIVGEYSKALFKGLLFVVIVSSYTKLRMVGL